MDNSEKRIFIKNAIINVIMIMIIRSVDNPEKEAGRNCHEI